VKHVIWVVAVLCVLIGSTGGAGSGESLDFVVIQPGQPGTSEEAQPTMDALAAYVQKHMGGGVTVKGRYFNEVEPALEHLRESAPKWGIVSMPFYLSHGRRLALKSLASSRPGGYDKDRWWLAVSTGAPDDWRQVNGVVSGTMLHESNTAACLLFQASAAGLPFTLNGTVQPLMALRQVMKGKAAAVVLDRVQYEAIRKTPAAESIKVIHQSQDLPFSPVVWLGGLEARQKQLTVVFQDMKKNPEGQALLRQLQTDGFGPADGDLERLMRDDDHGPCKP
jgi:hypothetical protein